MSAPPDPRIGTVGATLTSLAFHALIYWVIVTYGTVPELDFDFEMPTEIELGMTDTMEAADGDFSPPETPPEAAAGGETGAAEGEGAAADAGTPRPDAGPPDAGPPDAGPLVAEGSGEGEDESTLPAGAQIAIRIDMARVRASELDQDVRRLMAAIPDWQLLLEGSGIEPLDDLDRLLIASPNLQRSQLVLAGRHAHPDEGAQYIRDVVARFAEARGVEAPWGQRHGVPVAPWPNEDSTERVVAIVGPRHFVIARPQDLPTILAIAVAREETEEDEEALEEALEEATGPDALLSMGEGEAFSVEVEGARNFVRGRVRHIPERLRLAVSEDDEAILKGRARYEDEDAAAAALTYWEAQRDRYARALFVGSYVRGLELEADGRFIDVEHRLSFGQARFALGMLQGAVEQRGRDRQRRSSMDASPMEAEPSSAME
jgi:hypothetical protein